MLGRHEHVVFVNRVKTLDAQYENSKNILTFADDMPGQVGHAGGQQAKVVQQRLHAAMKAKKERKCASLFKANRQKKYKKQVLLKRFSEDYEKGIDQNKEEFAVYQSLLEKYKSLRDTQRQKEGEQDQNEEQESLHEVIQTIKEEYLSDLNPEEVPNSDVSDGDAAELEGQDQGSSAAAESQPNPSTLELVKNQSQIYID